MRPLAAPGYRSLATRAPNWLSSWWPWLLGYVFLSTLGHLVLDATYGFALYLANGGVLLAGAITLFDHSRRGFHAFLVLAALCDFVVKVYLVREPFATAGVASVTLVLQAWAGCWLIHLNAPASKLPNTLARVTGFLLYGAAIPTLLSAGLMLALFRTGLDGAPYSMDGWLFWIWWWVRRITSLVLVAPLLLLLLDRVTHKAVSDRYLDIRFLVSLILGAALSIVVFTHGTIGSGSFPAQSYLLIPVMLFMAIWLPLEKSLAVVLAVTLVAYWADSAGVPLAAGQGIGSMLTLSLFLVINAVIVWMLGALIHERQSAYQKLERQNAISRMKSQLNEFLIKEGSTQPQVFREACRILVTEGMFSRVCIDESCLDGVVSAGRQTCMYSDSEGKVREVADVSSDCFISPAVSLDAPAFFSCLDNSGKGARGDQVTHAGVFPLMKQGQAFATLSVFSADHQIFEPDLSRSIQEMIDDIGFALAMYDTQARLKQTAEVFLHSKEAIMITDRHGGIVDVNAAFTKLTGYSKDEVLGQNARVLISVKEDRAFYKDLFDMLAVKGFWSGELWKRTREGKALPFRGTVSAVFDGEGKVQHLISVMEDASEQLSYEQRIEKLANFDPLTRLPSRHYLRTQFERCVGENGTGQAWSLVFADLDGFKHVNDALGHHIGDRLLQHVAMRMQSCIRAGDLLCRFGGDEFVLLIKGDRKPVKELAARLRKKVAEPFQIESYDIQIDISLGIAVAGNDGDELDTLVQAADTAMYHAKATGGSRHCFYSPAMKEDARTRLTLRRELQIAIDQEQLFVLFQPKVDCSSGQPEVSGFEALVRWQHPEKGLISPGIFIPTAEENGQISDIDRWVMEQVLEQLGEWVQRYQDRVMPVSVNVSASLFSRAHFAETLLEMLENAAVPAHLIELEVTEHVAMAGFHRTLETMQKLKSMGVSLAIDDFGTGHSNLAYLREFPVNRLKIDIAFVKGIEL
ncbi:EAL domain-containing protein [Marinobacter sp. AN1]|nr:EAL domain-containing protein [Marinobacter sp. AN1]UZD64975.1 EAL domain-containing protein [Marinobacter sp. AN1]